MNRKSNILAAFLVLALALLLTACGTGGDRVERFADTISRESKSIVVPSYETFLLIGHKQVSQIKRFDNTEIRKVVA